MVVSLAATAYLMNELKDHITLAMVLMSGSLFGFQFLINNLQTLPSDYFSGKNVGTVAGLGGTSAVLGTVIFHQGPDFAPAINGMFTPSDLAELAARAARVKKLRDQMTFAWPLENCRQRGELRFECLGSDDVQTGRNGEKIRAFALYTARIDEDGLAGRRSLLRVNLSFTVEGDGDAYVTMDYPLDNCVAR